MVMDRQFKAIGRLKPQQRKHFLDIQIIRNRQLIKAPLRKEICR